MEWVLRVAFRQVADSPEPLPAGVTLRYATWLPVVAGVLSRMHGPAAAITFGRTIVVHPRVRITERLIRHELAHVRQWQENRLFPLHYLMSHLRYGYEQNPYEVEARAAERS